MCFGLISATKMMEEMTLITHARNRTSYRMRHKCNYIEKRIYERKTGEGTPDRETDRINCYELDFDLDRNPAQVQ